MTKVLLPFAAALIAGGLTAQTAATNTLTAAKEFGVQADAGNAIKKTAQPGALPKPVLLEARDAGAVRDHHAYAKMQVGLYSGMLGPGPGLNGRPGGYLLNVGTAVAPERLAAQALSIGQDANFDWAFKTGGELNGKVLVFFEGYIYGGAKITANIDKKLLDPGILEGKFALKDEIPVAKATDIALNFGMVADSGKVAGGKASYHGHLYFYFVPEPVLPTFKWVVPTQAANCAAGKLVDPSPITAGVPFDIALTGATDTGTVATPYALLFIGANDKNLFFIPLPFDLTPIGGFIPGTPDVACLLFIDIHGQRPAKLENGAAKLPFSIPRGLYFREVFFQWAYTSDATKLGLVFTDYAKLVRQ